MTLFLVLVHDRETKFVSGPWASKGWEPLVYHFRYIVFGCVIEIVNKLVPCVWLSSGALEIWRLCTKSTRPICDDSKTWINQVETYLNLISMSIIGLVQADQHNMKMVQKACFCNLQFINIRSKNIWGPTNIRQLCREWPDGHFPPVTTCSLLGPIFSGPGSGYEYQHLRAFYLLHNVHWFLLLQWMN